MDSEPTYRRGVGARHRRGAWTSGRRFDGGSTSTAAIGRRTLRTS